jgi:hypothetical protein
MSLRISADFRRLFHPGTACRQTTSCDPREQMELYNLARFRWMPLKARLLICALVSDPNTETLIGAISGSLIIARKNDRTDAPAGETIPARDGAQRTRSAKGACENSPIFHTAFRRPCFSSAYEVGTIANWHRADLGCREVSSCPEQPGQGAPCAASGRYSRLNR